MNIRDLPSILRTLLVCGPALISTACTNDQTVEDRLAETYLSRQRDSVITNWQARLLDEPRCDRFRQLHRTHGERFSSAASGGFVQAMQDVRNAARLDASCRNALLECQPAAGNRRLSLEGSFRAVASLGHSTC